MDNQYESFTGTFTNDIPAAQTLRAKAEQKGAEVKEKVQQLTERANERADAGLTAVGSTMSSVAQSLRGNAPSVVDAAERTAGKLESAGSYLKSADGRQLMHDVGEGVKKHPVPAMMTAAAFGFLLARRVWR